MANNEYLAGLARLRVEKLEHEKSTRKILVAPRLKRRDVERIRDEERGKIFANTWALKTAHARDVERMATFGKAYLSNTKRIPMDGRKLMHYIFWQPNKPDSEQEIMLACFGDISFHPSITMVRAFCDAVCEIYAVL